MRGDFVGHDRRLAGSHIGGEIIKIALVGATGLIGSKVLAEASRRGHTITAMCRNPDKVPALSGVTSRKVDILTRRQAEVAFAGHNIVISCFNSGHNPAPGQNVYMDIIDGVANMIKATKSSGVNRLLFVGGAGALYASPGTQMIDLSMFNSGEISGTDWPEGLAAKMPPEFALWEKVLRKDIKHEHVRPLVHALMFFEHDRTYDWSFFSPPAGLHPGSGKGIYLAGTNQVPMNGEKFAGLAIEDAAIAIVDELETNAHNHQHWTAYTPT